MSCNWQYYAVCLAAMCRFRIDVLGVDCCMSSVVHDSNCVKTDWSYKRRISLEERKKDVKTYQSIYKHLRPCVIEIHDAAQPDLLGDDACIWLYEDWTLEKIFYTLLGNSISESDIKQITRVHEAGFEQITFFIQGNPKLKWSNKACKNTIVSNITLRKLYEQYRDKEDGILYISYQLS